MAGDDGGVSLVSIYAVDSHAAVAYELDLQFGFGSHTFDTDKRVALV